MCRHSMNQLGANFRLIFSYKTLEHILSFAIVESTASPQGLGFDARRVQNLLSDPPTVSMIIVPFLRDYLFLQHIAYVFRHQLWIKIAVGVRLTDNLVTDPAVSVLSLTYSIQHVNPLNLTLSLPQQCCAIDYILHTLDSATALLNSPRAFPSR